jgi:hypothetical protein
MTWITTPNGDMPTRYGNLLPEGMVDVAVAEEMVKWTHIHEAGHAVASLAEGFELKHTEIFDEPRGASAGSTVIHVDDWFQNPPSLAFYAAGERAIDRWLVNEGLWTPEMAVMAEASASADRVVGNYIWRLVEAHDMADKMLAANWAAVVAVANELARAKRLSGEDVGDIVAGVMGIGVEIT